MTLDEAIKHCEEVAENYRCQRDDAADINDVGAASDCQQCADDHEQLAKWLQELKEAKKFIRKVQNELMKGTSFYSTSFLEENGELMDKLTKGVEYLDD